MEVFILKQEAANEISACVVGAGMGVRDSHMYVSGSVEEIAYVSGKAGSLCGI